VAAWSLLDRAGKCLTVRTSIAPVGLLVALLSITEDAEMKYRGPQRNAFEFLLHLSVALGCLPSEFSVIENSFSRRAVLTCTAPPAALLMLNVGCPIINHAGGVAAAPPA
jgi:hypothetical protein